MQPAPRHLLLIAALLPLAACGFNFQKQSVVLDRRILAMSVEPPEIIMDGSALPSVQIRALVVDPSHPAAPIPYEWRSCIPNLNLGPATVPAIGYDSISGRCKEDDETTLVPHDSAVLLGSPNPVNVQTVAAQQLGLAGTLGFYVEMYQQIQLRVDDAPAPIYGIKRLVLSSPFPAGREPNKTPHLLALTFDGQPWDASTPLKITPGKCADDHKGTVSNTKKPGTDYLACWHLITPVFTDDQAEPYVRQAFSFDAEGKPTGSIIALNERLRFSWFTDDGEFSLETTAQPDGLGPQSFDPLSTKWYEPATPGTVSNLWVVVRDGRGGESWELRQIEFAQP